MIVCHGFRALVDERAEKLLQLVDRQLYSRVLEAERHVLGTNTSRSREEGDEFLEVGVVV